MVLREYNSCSSIIDKSMYFRYHQLQLKILLLLMITFENYLQRREQMKKQNTSRLKKTSIKETPEARKKRVSSGVKFRATVFQDKRLKLRDKAYKNDDN